MKKLFPLVLIALFMCWSLTFADLAPTKSPASVSYEPGSLTTNIAPDQVIYYDEAPNGSFSRIQSNDVPSYPSPTVEVCPDTSLFGQVPYTPEGSWWFGTSDSVQGYRRYESYTLTGQICDIHFWGLSLHWNGAGWDNCPDETMAFDIVFYTDNAGLPGTPTCTYTAVVPVKTATGDSYSGYPMYRFDVESLAPCCDQQTGWVSIQGVSVGNPDCWILLAGSPNGDGSSMIWDGTQFVTEVQDIAVCLTGPGSQTLGACCNDNNGACVENVPQAQCPTGTPGVRWAANTLCADLVPPCGTTIGACCDDLGNCTQTDQPSCTGTWMPNTPCDPNPCPVAPPCTLVCPTNGIPEGEPDCYDDYVDSTNIGCNAEAPALPVFTPINIGDTICGTAGTFVFGGTANQRDTDWYRLVLNSDATLIWSGVAEFDFLMFIIDAGSEDCVDFSVITSATAPACSTLTISAPVTPGVYYLWAGPANFTGVPCGSPYIVTVQAGAAPTGACCIGDQCVSTNTHSECNALQGDWYMGENCANFQCPLLPLECPPNSMFSQLPTLSGGNWTFGNSEPYLGPNGDGYLIFEDFTGLTGEVCDIHFWGAQLYNSPSWHDCGEDPVPFNITFYGDNGGIPDTANPLCSYTEMISGTPTGEIYLGIIEAKKYSVDISPCCSITDGWISIGGAGDSLCWFMWLSSGETGSGFSYQMWMDGDSLVASDYDMSLCLTPSTGTGCDYTVGDVNGSGSYNGLDITYGVAFFKGGNAPLCDPNCPPCAGWNYCGDVNGSCTYNGLDITYGVAYFKGGNGPIPCPDCPPSP